MSNILKSGLTFNTDRAWSSFSILRFIGVQMVIATIILIFVCPSCWMTWEGIINLIPDFLISFTFSSVLSFGGNFVDSYFDKRISWIDKPRKRLFLTVITYMSYSFVASYILILLMTLIGGQIQLDNIPWLELISYTQMPMTAALIFMSLFTTWSWLGEWRKSAIETEQLKSEKLASQYQGLKDQLNPHFLFNSLNTLSGLVYEDADRSAAFIQKLSRIYRYVLEVQKEELVTLEQEISFAKNYLELQKIRFEESLQFKIDLSSQTGFLPPLSLQLLLENAIKHNIVSQEFPLFIHIYEKENILWVSNSFQPKSGQSETSSGVGLKNIELRYQLISDKSPEIIQTKNEFLVSLPILSIST
ncbi:sensor histidine kinase [Algoriphagus machipongonensis]|uniref:Histidine kinase family protein n=1 Tax=Algoriphagus machipongonensis TaxID=388413 RepID=A3HUX4_9BACT|nr:sensor histidine kinase [Algoriphagus machipongonensis]EAZ81946.1 histidine kinase family protein [Algoriphagus machipongonensis]